MNQLAERIPSRYVVGATFILLAIAAGIGVALASSPGSLKSAGRSSIGQSASPARTPTPSPTGAPSSPSPPVLTQGSQGRTPASSPYPRKVP